MSESAPGSRKRRRTSLRLRITFGVIVYMLLLSLAVVFHGNQVNERAERLMWRSLLDQEFDHYLQRRAEEPGYRWHGSDGTVLYGATGMPPLPPALAAMGDGLHDDMRIDGIRRTVMVRTVEGRRLAMAYDVTSFEDEEKHLSTLMIGSALGGMLLASLAIALGLRRMVRPLTRLARDIGSLRPDRRGERIVLEPRASSEMVVIADALNGYIQRNERFVERERAFIDSSSHELRTPIAVIAGASELALSQPGTPAPVRAQLGRIQRTARGVEQLVSLLLVLAKDPERLAESSDHMRLDHMLVRLVEDHAHLCADKHLQVCVAPDLPQCEIFAPEAIVQAAIGNLLRNAIENSDSGTIVAALDARGVVTIDDPGHGMTPEQISAIYTKIARGGARDGGGIGLDLIARLCEHLGWRLELQPRTPRGTRAVLDLSPALVGPARA